MPSDTYLDPQLDRTVIAPLHDDDRALPPQDLVARLYRPMRLARTIEERLAELYRQGELHGAVYLGMGQEAIATGIVDLLAEDDYFVTVSRELAGWLVRGVAPRDVFARWFGKDIAPSHGRDLGLFLADLDETGLAPYHPMMGAWIPQGAGFALAFKLRREPRIFAAFTGDGATSPGDFYEGLNLAAIHKVPLLVVVPNNGYAYSTPPQRQMPVANVADRAPAFGIPSAVGNGADVFEVRQLARTAIDHVRGGNGPFLLELKCFRWRGHGEHDDMSYVDEQQRTFWMERDPLRLLGDYLTRETSITEEDLEAVAEECRDIVASAVEEARALPDPSGDGAHGGLFAP